MRSDDPRKIAAALVVLVLALGMLGFQLFRRENPRPRSSAVGGPEEPAETMEDVVAVVPESPAVFVPDRDVSNILRRNPFLRPAPTTDGERVRQTAPAAGGSRRGRLQVTGIRTGPRPMAIIDDRFRWVGDSVREWRILAIDRDRVTLERSDGRTTDLVLR